MWCDGRHDRRRDRLDVERRLPGDDHHSCTYANWAAFAAANPTVKVAKKDIVFIEADVPGNYHVFDFQFG